MHLFSFLFLVLLSACSPGADTHVSASKSAASPQGRESEMARRAVVPVYRDIAASVRSLDHILLAAESTGRVLRLQADVGDLVSEGDLLAELDDSSLLAACETARAGLELSRAEADRISRLRETRVASEREWDLAQTQLRQAKARLQLAEIALSKTKVLAPVSGVIEERRVGAGDLAVPGTPLFRLYDPTRICLEARLPVSDRGHASLGAQLSWELFNETGVGAVSEVAPSSDSSSRTIRIRIPLPEELRLNGALPAPGTFGTIRYQVGSREQILVPSRAIFKVGQVEMVQVFDGESWVRKSVRTGSVSGNQVEILAGLSGSERIAVQ